jgi:Pilus biogenesis CpaD protein (pilus_cpaD)
VHARTVVTPYPAGPNAVAPMRLSFSGLKATVADRCGQWPRDLGIGSGAPEDWNNKPYWNFGCAYQTAFAAQVADPRDLESHQAETPADTELRTKVIESLRNRRSPGIDPGTVWRLQGSAISTVGGGVLMQTHAGFDPDQIAPVPRISLQAFCESEETARMIEAAAGDRRMDRAHASVHTGGPAAAVSAFRDAPTPNVLVLETAESRGELLSHLESLAEFCDTATKLLVIGRTNDIILYRELMARGVSEYLVAPLNVIESSTRSPVFTPSAGRSRSARSSP